MESADSGNSAEVSATKRPMNAITPHGPRAATHASMASRWCSMSRPSATMAIANKHAHHEVGEHALEIRAPETATHAVAEVVMQGGVRTCHGRQLRASRGSL